jgi:transposase InsO family protein
VRLHANAKLTPSGRYALVVQVLEQGRAVRQVAAGAQVSRQTLYKWLHRFRSEGRAGLDDRSSRPHRIAGRTPASTVRRIEQLRRHRKAGWEIALELGVPVSTVSRHLQALGLGRLWRLQEAEAPPVRYEHDRPGRLFHVDAKKLARIVGIGHAIHGDRSRKQRGVGWEVVLVCVDDHTRLAYAEVVPSEDAQHAAAFFERALRWFERRGIRCERVLTDNAKCYGSKAFVAACQARGVRQSFTRPYTPKTNGKAERFIQTLKRRWAYRYAYRTSAIRAASLRPWLDHYNHHRPHRALGKRTPMDRLREAGQQAA